MVLDRDKRVRADVIWDRKPTQRRQQDHACATTYLVNRRRLRALQITWMGAARVGIGTAVQVTPVRVAYVYPPPISILAPDRLKEKHNSRHPPPPLLTVLICMSPVFSIKSRRLVAFPSNFFKLRLFLLLYLLSIQCGALVTTFQ